MDEHTYRVVRMYERAGIRKRVMASGLTLEEAQEWCRDPETSSQTATSYEGQLRTEHMGHWFDGYEVER